MCWLAAVFADDFGYNNNHLATSENNIILENKRRFEAAFDALGQQTITETPVAEPALLTSEFRKEFYLFSAAEDTSEEEDFNAKIASSLNRNVRVVFIKAPENKAFEQAALALAEQAAKQRIAIFVLAKQNDIESLAQRLQIIRSQSQNKPDVQFIKYRTDEDIFNAQKAIKDQYNIAMPDTESNVPVLNFASIASVGPEFSSPGRGYQ